MVRFRTTGAVSVAVGPCFRASRSATAARRTCCPMINHGCKTMAMHGASTMSWTRSGSNCRARNFACALSAPMRFMSNASRYRVRWRQAGEMSLHNTGFHTSVHHSSGAIWNKITKAGDRHAIGTHLGVQFGPPWVVRGERPVRPLKGLARPLSQPTLFNPQFCPTIGVHLRHPIFPRTCLPRDSRLGAWRKRLGRPGSLTDQRLPAKDGFERRRPAG